MQEQGPIRVILDPKQRAEYVRTQLSYDGLSNVEEDPKAAYCPISLTFTPDEVKLHISKRQELLLSVLEAAGLKGYDPGSAPFSPDKDLSFQPSQIYMVDSGKIAGARFFVGHHLLPSTGHGVEMEKAKTLNRIAVNLMDRRHRVGRMQPHRMINLQYDNFEEQRNEFIEVFQMLQEYEPGLGFNGEIPSLLGFDQHGNVVDLEQEVYRRFPNLQYSYNGKAAIIGLELQRAYIIAQTRNLI